MERENLEFISEKILIYIEKISYDSTIEFMAFKTDMYRNIERFLSPESVEYYNENVETLKQVALKKREEKPLFYEYLKKLSFELLNYIDSIHPEKKDMKNFEKDKIDIISNIGIFLNPYNYLDNIQMLDRNRHQKRLTKPHGWC